MRLRSALLLLTTPFLVWAAGCALLRSTTEDVPPPAMTARDFWHLSPENQERVLPRPRRYQANEWLDRLVCKTDASHAEWRRLDVRGSIERYSVDCAVDGRHTLRLDVADSPPSPPPGLRLLAEAGFIPYKTALERSARKEWDGALSSLSEAIEQVPDEPAYRIARLAFLLSMERAQDVLDEADALLASPAPAIVWKYRGLAASALGRPDELLKSINGLIDATRPGNPLYGEAVCTRGLLLSNTRFESLQSTLDIEEGCELREDACCRKLEEDRAAARAAERAIDATRALGISFEPNDAPPPASE